MNEQNWLLNQLQHAKEEVQSWEEWKQSAMLKGAMTLSSSDSLTHKVADNETQPTSDTSTGESR